MGGGESNENLQGEGRQEGKKPRAGRKKGARSSFYSSMPYYYYKRTPTMEFPTIYIVKLYLPSVWLP